MGIADGLDMFVGGKVVTDDTAINGNTASRPSTTWAE
jgi:hypothetical protein